jgi:hypothetical protein
MNQPLTPQDTWCIQCPSFRWGPEWSSITLHLGCQSILPSHSRVCHFVWVQVRKTRLLIGGACSPSMLFGVPRLTTPR